jgi:hypothetical protein
LIDFFEIFLIDGHFSRLGDERRGMRGKWDSIDRCTMIDLIDNINFLCGFFFFRSLLSHIFFVGYFVCLSVFSLVK